MCSSWPMIKAAQLLTISWILFLMVGSTWSDNTSLTLGTCMDWRTQVDYRRMNHLLTTLRKKFLEFGEKRCKPFNIPSMIQVALVARLAFGKWSGQQLIGVLPKLLESNKMDFSKMGWQHLRVTNGWISLSFCGWSTPNFREGYGTSRNSLSRYSSV